MAEDVTKDPIIKNLPPISSVSSEIKKVYLTGYAVSRESLPLRIRFNFFYDSPDRYVLLIRDFEQNSLVQYTCNQSSISFDSEFNKLKHSLDSVYVHFLFNRMEQRSKLEIFSFEPQERTKKSNNYLYIDFRSLLQDCNLVSSEKYGRNKRLTLESEAKEIYNVTINEQRLFPVTRFEIKSPSAREPRFCIDSIAINDDILDFSFDMPSKKVLGNIIPVVDEVVFPRPRGKKELVAQMDKILLIRLAFSRPDLRVEAQKYSTEPIDWETAKNNYEQVAPKLDRIMNDNIRVKIK